MTETILTNDSVLFRVASQTEQWYTPGIQFVCRAKIYNGTSRVKMEQTIINKGSTETTWGVSSIAQEIVNHLGKTDYQNFWSNLPINPNSVFGSSGAPVGILETESISQLASKVDTKIPEVASKYHLFPNYPKQFNGGTAITIYCPRVLQGSLKIYDIPRKTGGTARFRKIHGGLTSLSL